MASRIKRPGKLARRYAAALLQALRAEAGSDLENQLRTAAAQLRAFANALEPSRDALLSPMFPREERLAGLHAVLQQLGLVGSFGRFLQILFERERLDHLLEIASSFEEQVNHALSVIAVDIITVNALSDAEKQQIAQELQQKLGSRLEFTWHVEPQLIGGMVVRYGGKVIDGSIAGRLEKLGHALSV